MAILAQKYAIALRRVNILLPVELVQELLDLMSDLKSTGKVRQTNDSKYSVLDFFRNVVKKGSPNEVFKRLTETHPDVITNCDYISFPRSDGRVNIKKTPVADEFGVLVITYLLPGELGDRPYGNYCCHPTRNLLRAFTLVKFKHCNIFHSASTIKRG